MSEAIRFKTKDHAGFSSVDTARDAEATRARRVCAGMHLGHCHTDGLRSAAVVHRRGDQIDARSRWRSFDWRTLRGTEIAWGQLAVAEDDLLEDDSRIDHADLQ